MSIPAPQQSSPAPSWLTLLFAAACGLVVANLYYAQPLVAPISVALGIPPALAGFVVTLTQVGYGLGLIFIVPTADMFENRRLVITLLAVCAAALVLATAAGSALLFFAAAAAIGLSAVAVQVLVPFAAHLAPEASRGRVVGNVMSGLLLGIMLARPASSFIASFWGWHAVFGISAVLMILLAAVLAFLLPQRKPHHTLSYGQVLATMFGLLGSVEVLRRRALYHAFLFAAFSMFWTTAPLLLAGPAFQLGQRGIALFALAGVAGAIAAPIAGRLADRGHGRAVTVLAMVLVAGGFVLALFAQSGSPLALGLLTAVAIIVDFGVSANLVTAQREIFALGAEIRSRLNGMFMAIFFAGGAIGSAAGAWAYAHGGWTATACIGIALPVLALLYYATERRPAEKVEAQEPVRRRA